MNKQEFINELSIQINYPIDKCKMINEILENNFFISKKSKFNIINELKYKLEVSDEEAELIYLTAVKIVKEEVKNKLKHPFKSKD